MCQPNLAEILLRLHLTPLDSTLENLCKTPAALTFCAELSSIKRPVAKTRRGESLAPKKCPGSAPKLG